jgi:hypothetical protein
MQYRLLSIQEIARNMYSRDSSIFQFYFILRKWEKIATVECQWGNINVTPEQSL